MTQLQESQAETARKSKTKKKKKIIKCSTNAYLVTTVQTLDTVDISLLAEMTERRVAVFNLYYIFDSLICGKTD